MLCCGHFSAPADKLAPSFPGYFKGKRFLKMIKAEDLNRAEENYQALVET